MASLPEDFRRREHLCLTCEMRWGGVLKSLDFATQLRTGSPPWVWFETSSSVCWVSYSWWIHPSTARSCAHSLLSQFKHFWTLHNRGLFLNYLKVIFTNVRSIYWVSYISLCIACTGSESNNHNSCGLNPISLIALWWEREKRKWSKFWFQGCGSALVILTESSFLAQWKHWSGASPSEPQSPLKVPEKTTTSRW